MEAHPPEPPPPRPDLTVAGDKGEVLLYQTEDGRTRVECRFQDETIWLPQALLAELYQKDVRTISEHLKGIYEDGELEPEATIRKFRIVRREGQREVARQIEHYSLDAILADCQLPNMGLTSWKSGEVRRPDVTVAKNYLAAEEIDELNRIVVMWLDFAEDQARRRRQVFMKDWQQRLDDFLAFNERQVLIHAGSVTKAEADAHALEQFDRFAQRRRAFKESHGEHDALRALEDAAKRLPPKGAAGPPERSGP